MKMKWIAAMMVALLLPVAFAASFGSGIGVDIGTEDFVPLVWMCDSRVVYDDGTEPGRVTGDGVQMDERINNYAFEGEQIAWTVLVMDKNGINKVEDVFAVVGEEQEDLEDDAEDLIQANCVEAASPGTAIPASCNARILEEELTVFDPLVMRYYRCTLTVESPVFVGSMASNDAFYGEHWISVVAQDLDGAVGVMDENEYWFFNPVISLGIDGDGLNFEDVRPGTDSYSDTVLLENQADDGSGVMLDMFISGTDFYDTSNSGAMCPTTNQLSLGAFRYYAVNGAYSTIASGVTDTPLNGNIRNVDTEGYVNIDYGIGFNDPVAFYNNMEIIQAGPMLGGAYYGANLLAPGAEMAITFKLSLPEPCNGDFDAGTIYFWGEAI